jgi:hypothetical protein
VPAPTFYRPIGVGENNTVEINSSITGASILYKLGNGAEQSYEGSVAFDEASTITARVEYVENGITYKSEESQFELTTPISLASGRIIDFSFAENLTADIIPTIGDEVVTSINSSDYYSITLGDYGLVEDFVVEPFTTTEAESGYQWWLRKAQSGLYCYAVNKNLAIQNLKAGQYVKISGRKGNADFRLSLINNDVATLISESSQITSGATFYTYQINKDGALAVRMSKNGYLETIEIYNQTIDVAVTSAGYSTFFWDKPAKYDSDQVTAYTGTLSEDKTALNLTEITTGVIPANTAVILKAEEGNYTFEATETNDVITDNALEGTTTNLAISEVSGIVYVLSTSEANGVGFYKFSGKTLAANKAYLVLPAAETAPMVRFNFDEGNVGNVTGIESIEAENGAQARIFDLQGRSLRQAPQKGMYILNGHKVIR